MEGLSYCPKTLAPGFLTVRCEVHPQELLGRGTGDATNTEARTPRPSGSDLHQETQVQWELQL